jgi:adenylate cyclase
VIDPVVSALSSVVGRYDGFVEKFAGDALLALFGAPVSHDDDAARALSVALEMHAELERMKDVLPEDARDLTLHVGVNSGHGIARIIGSEARTDYAVLGDAVILAQRLESAAPPGETYVSETTVRLTEHRFELEPVGELTLKGKSEPVPAWRLVGERSAARRRGQSPMVNRDRELAALMDALTPGSVVAVTGEAGVGKSRLLEEARAALYERGVRCLNGRCLSYGAAVPYWPFTELLRREDRPTDPFLAQLLGYSERDLAPEAFRRGLHDSIAAWLASLGDVVFVLEDVHWLDAASQALVADLARRRSVTLLLTGRPEAEAVLVELAPERRRIVLTPLDEHGVEKLIGAQLGARPPRGLATFIGARAAGNPFFVQELLRALQESGALARVESAWQMRAGWDARELPPTIEEVLAGRMDALSRLAAATLQAAAVIGRRVPRALLGAVGADLGSAPELVAGGFLDEIEGGFAFHHALVQDVAYERLLRKRRRELHAKVAEQAEALYGAGDDTIDLLARHLYLAGDPKAPGYLRRAAARARSLYANEEAILHLSRCAELEPDDAELKLDLADLFELVGRYDDALELYQHGRDVAGDVRAWRGLVAVHRQRGEYWEALAAASDALATDIASTPDATAVWIEAGRSLFLAGRAQEAVDALTGALAAAESAGGGPLVAELLTQLARAEGEIGEYEHELQHALASAALLSADDRLAAHATALRVAGGAYWALERLAEAEATLRGALEIAIRAGRAEEIGGCLLNLALVEKAAGHFVAAIDHERQAVEEFERIAHGSGRAQAYANLAQSLEEGNVDLDEAAVNADRARCVGRTIGYPMAVADGTNTLACIALKRGETAEAAALAEEAAALYDDVGDRTRAHALLELAADAWGRSGDEWRARHCGERARDLATIA